MATFGEGDVDPHTTGEVDPEANTTVAGEQEIENDIAPTEAGARARFPSRKVLENKLTELLKKFNIRWKITKKYAAHLLTISDSAQNIKAGISLVSSSLAEYSETFNELEDIFIAGKLYFKNDEENIRQHFEKNSAFAKESISTARLTLVDLEMETRTNSSRKTHASRASSRGSHRTRESRGSGSQSSSYKRALLAAEAAAAEKEVQFEKEIMEAEVRKLKMEAEVRQLKAEQKASSLSAKAAEFARLCDDNGAFFPPYTSPDDTSNDHIQRYLSDVKDNFGTQSKLKNLNDAHVTQKPHQDSNKPPPGDHVDNTYQRNTPDTTNIPKSEDTRRPNANVSDSQRHTAENAMAASCRELGKMLARQKIPQNEPFIFDGEPTMFLPWSNTIKYMIEDAELNPYQELNLMRSYTTDGPQTLIDNFLKRHYNDPARAKCEAWGELESRFGDQNVIALHLKRKLISLANFSDTENLKLREFSDECRNANAQLDILPGLGSLNFPESMATLLEKLPKFVTDKWATKVHYYQKKHNKFPDFSHFTEFVTELSDIRNNPMLQPNLSQDKPVKIHVRKTTQDDTSPPKYKCKYHSSNTHSTISCRDLASLDFAEKSRLLRTWGLCYKCADPDDHHLAAKCKNSVYCSKCRSDTHCDLMCRNLPSRSLSFRSRAASTPTTSQDQKPQDHHPEQKSEASDSGEAVKTMSTRTDSMLSTRSKSCGKIILAKLFLRDSPENSVTTYVTLDDQSDGSLISSSLLDKLGHDFPTTRYTLTTCDRAHEQKIGRRANDIMIQTMDGENVYPLSTVLECDSIPADHDEIPDHNEVKKWPHLADIAAHIPVLDKTIGMDLLLGRDCSRLMKVRESRNG